jgi:membrane associated rhomboid family serine protease
MFKRQRTGSVVCSSCGSLVGVNDDRCYTCGRRNPGLWGYAPLLRAFANSTSFVDLIVYGCSILYAATLLVTLLLGRSILGGSVFGLLAPDPYVAIAFGASGAAPVFGLGLWWTLLSAGWLHGSALHILFNMLWVRQLGPVVGDIYGAARMVIIYTIAGVAGFLLSSLAGEYMRYAPLPFLRGAESTLGASAPIFGLLGALVHYGRRGGSSLVGGQAMQYAVILFVYGLLWPGGGIDNYAHAGGFAGGYLASLWLDPLKPERTDHFIGAVICLVATALAILASMFTMLPVIIRAFRG